MRIPPERRGRAMISSVTGRSAVATWRLGVLSRLDGGGGSGAGALPLPVTWLGVLSRREGGGGSGAGVSTLPVKDDTSLPPPCMLGDDIV